MAQKRPKSILSGLKNMLHLDAEKPSKPAAKPSAPARKKPAEKRAAPAQPAKEQRPAAPAAGDPAAAEPTPEKSKVKNQPWYRHRQRW